MWDFLQASSALVVWIHWILFLVGCFFLGYLFIPKLVEACFKSLVFAVFFGETGPSFRMRTNIQSPGFWWANRFSWALYFLKISLDSVPICGQCAHEGSTWPLLLIYSNMAFPKIPHLVQWFSMIFPFKPRLSSGIAKRHILILSQFYSFFQMILMVLICTDINPY